MVYDGFQRPVGIDWQNADKTYGQVRFGDDSQLVVLFFTKSVFDAAKSAAEGTRQYINKVYVRIQPPGERLNVIERPVQESDKRRFSAQWNSFLQNKTQVPEGTPIDLLFPNNPAVADNLKAFGVYTIQQCAKLSANAIETVGMGGRDWVNMANQYLENAQSGTAFLQLRTELDKKDQEIKLIKRNFELLKAQHDELMARLNNPNAFATQPAWVPGYDAQTERLEANHPSQEMRPSSRKKKERPAPPRDEVDQSNIIKQVTEEDFQQVDVTKLE